MSKEQSGRCPWFERSVQSLAFSSPQQCVCPNDRFRSDCWEDRKKNCQNGCEGFEKPHDPLTYPSGDFGTKMKKEPTASGGGHSRSRRDFVDEFAVCVELVTFDAEFVAL